MHEIDGPMQVTASMTPLRGMTTPPSAASVELVACVDPNYVAPGLVRLTDEDEALYIEGDAAATIRMLEEWIHVIELNAESLVEEGKLDPGWRDFSKRYDAYKKRPEP